MTCRVGGTNTQALVAAGDAMDFGDVTYRPDRTGWPEGPWMGEPDREDWDDPATGLACSLRRNVGGIWCGYVGVPRGHPLHGRRGKGLRGPFDLNYAGPHRLGWPGPAGWYLGFDCGGLSPAVSHLVWAALRGSPGMEGTMACERYRDVVEARETCVALAAAVARAGGGAARP